MVEKIPVDAHVVHEPGHISALPGEHHFRGSVVDADDRISSQARTDAQARALMCSREPKADPSAMVPDSGLRTSTVSCTYGVCNPSNSVLHSGGQSRRVAGRRTPPRGLKGGEGGVQGPEQWVELEGSNEQLPIVNEPFTTDALGLEGAGDELT